MAKRQARKSGNKRPIEQYEHPDKKRPNNPPVGLVTPETDRDSGKKTYLYDPHLDPQLVWAGKAERTSFEVPTVSLHVHERIDPRTIIEAVRKRNGNGNGGTLTPALSQREREQGTLTPGPSPGGRGVMRQTQLFERAEENPPLRDAVEFYKHAHNWTNRLIAGDSLLVMNSLLEKEGMAGKVQMIYIDPPYGIRYGSNFQPFTNKRDVKDGSDDDLTLEPETLKAFRDTWELGIHSYLTYLRDRLLLARELLHESGSCFVQISDENIHHVRELMDEVFGSTSFISLITFAKTTGATVDFLPPASDYILWYAKRREVTKYRPLYLRKAIGGAGGSNYNRVELPTGERRSLSREERDDLSALPSGSLVYSLDNLTSQSVGRDKGENAACWFPIKIGGKEYRPSYQARWKTNEAGMQNLTIGGRLEATESRVGYVRYFRDFPMFRVNNGWDDVGASFMADKKYVVQTSPTVIERCLLMTTDPGDLVLDPTCGSGTTAYVAEQWGRRWITCDTSRVAVTLAKQRLMTSVFDYYKLRYPEHPHPGPLPEGEGERHPHPGPLPEGEGVSGVGSGFVYKTVPHVTLKSIANNPEIKEGMTRVEIDAAIAKYAVRETLYDQPEIDKSKTRVTGPFTVEAVPAPVVRMISDPLTPAPSPRGRGEEDTLTPTLSHGEREQDTLTPTLSHGEREMRADASVARSGETVRQAEWRDELLKAGIRGKGGQQINFSRVEPLGGTRWLHADAETKAPHPGPLPKGEGERHPQPGPLPEGEGAGAQRAVLSFGPEHAPLEQRQVAMALEEAQTLKPTPRLVVFAAFQFDPEAAKDIDETNWPGVALLKAQMNADLLTDDLKKKRASNESFWLIGQPDIEVRRHPHPSPLPRGEGERHPHPGPLPRGEGERHPHPGPLPKGEGELFVVEVHGFDYYNTVKGTIESGDTSKIAMWLLDTDYDGRSLYPRQVFFPMAGPKDGWARLAKNLKAEIDEVLIEQYRGTESLPFAAGEHRRAAVKIVDDRGIESLRIVRLD